METIHDISEMRNSEFQVVLIIDVEDGRLNPLTQRTPRCLLPIANRCILSYQLDMLSMSGASEVFIVAPAEYTACLRQFQAKNIRDNMRIDYTFVEDMSGSVDALRAIADSIRGEFICLTADIMSQYSLTHLVNKHRLSASDITMLLSPIPFDESVKKGGAKVAVIDEEDKEFIGLDSDGRIIVKTAVLDLDDDHMTLSKAHLLKTNGMLLRNNLIDVGIYVMSKWILELIVEKKRFSSIRMDLIPYLIMRQFQKRDYLLKEIPALIHRKRYLSAIEPWLVSSQGGTKPYDLVSCLNKSFSEKDAESPSHSNENDEDLLRCYSLVWEPSTVSSDGKTQIAILQRIVNTKSYMNLNRDIPLVPHSAAIPWPKIENYMKKETSIVGPLCELGDKVMIQQCTIDQATKIGLKSKLNNCVVMSNVVIGENCVIQNTIICPNTIIESNCNLNNCLIGEGARVSAGSNIKNEHILLEDENM